MYCQRSLKHMLLFKLEIFNFLTNHQIIWKALVDIAEDICIILSYIGLNNKSLIKTCISNKPSLEKINFPSLL